MQFRSEKIRPVLVYLVTEDWYFLSHRLPMAQAAQRAGYDVHVATRVTTRGAEIEALGFKLHPLRWRRGSINPLALLSIVRQVRAVYRRVRPDLVHHIALQPAITGSLAAMNMNVMQLNALAGLGFTFTSRNVKARLIRPCLAALLRTLLNRPRAAVLVQNPDDGAAIAALGVPSERIFLVPGSGVDTDTLQPLPEPPGEVVAAFVGRLLDDKGLPTLIAAHQLLLESGDHIRLLIAGEPDPANPASIPAAQMKLWAQRPHVTLLGHVSDIRDVWAAAHIAVLPSRREGLPKSLLEAAACARPIVATDVPGCREIARAGENALLVPPDNAVALADAIRQLAREPQTRRQFAAAGRRLVEERFSSRQIGLQIVGLYDALIERRPLLQADGNAS